VNSDTINLGNMKARKPLSAADERAAERLRAIWDEKKDRLGLTQEKAADELGFRTQGAVGHYLNARIPLNVKATLKFARLLKVSPLDIREDFIELMARTLGVEPTEIPWVPGTAVQGAVEEAFAKSPDEKALLDSYRATDDRGKRTIMNVAEKESAHEVGPEREAS
jgi:transcriptional regulator with XRE-family HTH domain